MKFNKNRDKFQAEDVENNWAISYGDMITLLLAFFVLFFNIKTETVNLQLIKKDIDKFFKNAKTGRTPSAVPETEMKHKSSGVSPIYSADVTNALKIKSNINGQSILVEFPGIAFFPSASDQLTKEGQQALSDFAKAIAPHLGGFRLVVRGYTDNNPLKSHKRFKDNLELSAFRSISAIRFLNDEGVQLQYMRIAGYGETDLTTIRAPENLNMMDRKVVIVIEPLDHTERVALNEGESINSNKKPIEEVTSAKVVEASKTDVSPLYESLAVNGWKVYLSAKEVAKKEIMGLSREISKNDYYQSYVQRLVQKDLYKKGYSSNQVKKILEDYKNKESRQ